MGGKEGIALIIKWSKYRGVKIEDTVRVILALTEVVNKSSCTFLIRKVCDCAHVIMGAQLSAYPT